MKQIASATATEAPPPNSRPSRGVAGPWLLLIGFVGVLYVMFGWWADTVTENKEGDHTPVVLIGLRYGFILFIMSEVMFFVAWFWSFFKHAIPWHLQRVQNCLRHLLSPAMM